MTDAATRAEFRRITRSANFDMISALARKGRYYAGLDGYRTCSDACRQMLIGYVEQAEAYARNTPIAEPTDRYGRTVSAGSLGAERRQR